MRILAYIIFSSSLLFLFSCQESTSVKEDKSQQKEMAQKDLKPDPNLSKFGIAKESQSKVDALKVGSVAPAFSAKDQNGNHVDLNSITKTGDAVLVFYRGYWCGYCTKHLADFAQELENLKAKGTQVIAIAPEGAAGIAQSIEKTKLEIPFISDPEGKIMEKYGVAFKVNDMYKEKFKNYKNTTLEEVNGQDEAMLPIPATYLIGKNKKVKWVHFDPNYKERASLDDMIAAIGE